MADPAITASAVVSGTGAKTNTGIAGTTITAGQSLCKNPTGGKLELADCNGASAYMKTTVGIALHGASLNQPLAYQTEGPLTVNAVLTAGVIYVQSETAGGIKPTADIDSGDTINIIGVATATTSLNMKIFNSGAVL